MSAKETKRSSSAFVRLMLVLGIIGVVLIVGGVITLLSAQAAREAPLEVAVYPNAQEIGRQQIDNGHDWVHYATTDPYEQVRDFYTNLAPEADDCQEKEADNPEPGEPAVEVRCSFDGSLLFTTQTTVVIVQPGMNEYAGQTRISMERRWGQ